MASPYLGKLPPWQGDSQNGINFSNLRVMWVASGDSEKKASKILLLFSKWTLLGTPNREPQEYSRNITGICLRQRAKSHLRFRTPVSGFQVPFVLMVKLCCA